MDVYACVAQIVALADLDSVVAQNVVGGDDVEIEMGQRPVPEVFKAVRVEYQVLDQREQDRAVLGTLEGGRTRALHIIDRLGDAGLEIVEILLIVFKARRLLANQARKLLFYLARRFQPPNGAVDSMP